MKITLLVSALLLTTCQGPRIRRVPVIETPAPAPASKPPVMTVGFEIPGLDPEVLRAAMESRHCALLRGEVPPGHENRISIIDFSLPSSEKRLWVLDLEEGRVLFHERVAHGKNTGEIKAERFSNVEDSLQSSIGLFRTAEVYDGKHGRSLRLDGLEPGWNDLARQRAIVIHGADYVSEKYLAEAGQVGRSWGCPAVDRAVSDALIDAVYGGSLLFAWFPDNRYLSGSTYQGCGG